MNANNNLFFWKKKTIFQYIIAIFLNFAILIAILLIFSNMLLVLHIAIIAILLRCNLIVPKPGLDESCRDHPRDCCDVGCLSPV